MTRRKTNPAAPAPLRALFLDFDGVLHPTAGPTTGAAEAVHATLFTWVPHLAKLLRQHSDVVIVVHSTWRYTHNIEELASLLGPLEKRVVGSTPRGPRYESIRWWLSMNSDFSSYCILDDDAREFPVPAPAELILCDPSTGVADERVLAELHAWLER